MAAGSPFRHEMIQELRAAFEKAIADVEAGNTTNPYPSTDHRNAVWSDVQSKVNGIDARQKRG